MRILIATDAWHPQVNGVVRTLTSLARSAATLGADIGFLTPEGFPSVGVPTYPGLRIALPNRREIARRIEQAAPDAIHIATEGPIGWAVRGYCRRRKLAFTTSYTTRFPGICVGPHRASGQRRLRGAAAVSCRGVDDDGRNQFAAAGACRAGLPQARFLDPRRRHQPVSSGRARKPRPAAADLHDHGAGRGRKESRCVPVAGSAGHQGRGRRRSAESGTAGEISESCLPRREEGRGSRPPISPPPTCSYSRASPTPLASCNSRRWPAARRWRHSRSPGRKTSSPITRSAPWITICAARACARSTMSRETCRNFALERSWENSARQFIGNLTALQPSRSLAPVRRVAGRSAVQG